MKFTFNSTFSEIKYLVLAKKIFSFYNAQIFLSFRFELKSNQHSNSNTVFFIELNAIPENYDYLHMNVTAKYIHLKSFKVVMDEVFTGRLNDGENEEGIDLYVQ